jgi:hypothetical protein
MHWDGGTAGRGRGRGRGGGGDRDKEVASNDFSLGGVAIARSVELERLVTIVFSFSAFLFFPPFFW